MNVDVPTDRAAEAAQEAAAPPAHDPLLRLSFAALGVVYGDIGTSPLYALRECFADAHGVAPSPDNVLGVLSLISWSLLIVISVKYIVFVLRADNRGEGGILALMALLRSGGGTKSKDPWVLIGMGLFGASLLYGDGMITPAISVLSAVEGLEVATPYFSPYVVPITIVILVLLFLFQNQGTARIGRVFGPITLVWFVVLAALGVGHIAREPQVLAALNPLHGMSFLVRNGAQGFFVLGAVFLVVTGGEALYADMGHFGRRPIRTTWFALVLPALLLNYFGQGALVLGNPAEAHNPFYHLAPSWALYPLVALATAATVIASQAVISGCFSLTRQAVQLGYCPRVAIEHTSSEEIGQIYIRAVNWGLMLATIGLVLGFQSSSALAAAYGVAVTTTETLTTLLFYVIARRLWKWNVWTAATLSLVFLAIDLSFLGANIVKIPHGGWFPLAVACLLFALMSTWKRGRQILAERLNVGELPVRLLIEDIAANPPLRVPGTAVFMSARAYGTPAALLHNLKHNKVIHQQVVLVTILTAEAPRISHQERVDLSPLQSGFYRLIVRYGFMEDPNIPEALALAQSHGLEIDPMSTTFFLGRETLLATKRPGMALWREKLFAFMARNAQPTTNFFHIPPNQVIEIGTQVEL